MDADGSNKVQLPGTEDANWGVPRALDWSPDVENIAFASGDCNIYTTRADGSGTPRKLTSDPAWQCSESPAWSPDSKEIAFQSERNTNPNAVGDTKDIYVMQVSDTIQWRRLTDNPAQDAYPAWSLDGSEIAFTRSSPGGSGTSIIYKIDAEGAKETRLISGGLPTWLADGEHIAYLSSLGIAEMNSDGSNPTLVISNTPG
jgi:Tol biopolymer transport system component